MTNVVHVISGLGTGGAETMLVQLAAGLQTRGLSQTVVSLSGQAPMAERLRTDGIEVATFNAGSLVSLPGMLLALARKVHRAKPKVLQGWMYHGNIATTLVHLLCPGRPRRKLVWNLRASNMDDARYKHVIGLSGWLSRWPDTIVVNSEAGAAFHQARGFDASRFVVIDNGFDTSKFRPDPAIRKQVRNELGIPENALVVINVARVDPMKDHATLLDALSRVPHAVGLLVGRGTDTLSLPPTVRALGERQDVVRLLAAADIVASSSAFGEGFSNAIAEGMSAGLIPVATDVGDARRIIADTGFVVGPGDPQAFAEAVGKIAEMSPHERARRGMLARERIVAHFTLDTAIERYRALYLAA